MRLRDELGRIHAGEHMCDKRATQAYTTIQNRLRKYAWQGHRQMTFDAAYPLGIPVLHDPCVRKTVAEMLRNDGLTVIEKYYSIKVKW